MNSSIDATNKSARCLLKWVAESVNRPKVTEVLKERVRKIECAGDESSFKMTLVVDGGYAKQILKLHIGELEKCLRDGFHQQSELRLYELSVENLK